MKRPHLPIKGFTLLEMLLIMVVLASLMAVIISVTNVQTEELKRDKAVLQMQQILNAGLAYYLDNSQWGTKTNDVAEQLQSTSKLVQQGYLNSAPVSPWGGNYSIKTISATNVFQVAISAPNRTEANILASHVPMGYAIATSVYASVNVPGQNLANARSVNYAGVYHNGACVPVPSCPPNMTAQIVVTVASVNGVNDQPTCGNNNDASTCTGINAYAIASYTAYATASASVDGTSGTGPADCSTQAASGCLQDVTTGTYLASGNYWRACLNVVTSKGTVSPSIVAQGQLEGTILAVTRCAPNAEPNGSSISVFQ